jgi:hypothetical protein
MERTTAPRDGNGGRRPLVLTLTVALALPAVVLAWWGASEIFDSTASSHYRSTQPVSRVLLDTGDVDVAVRQADVHTVSADLSGSYFIDAPDMSEASDNGTLTITSDCGGDWTMSNCDAHLSVVVPRDVSVSLDGGTGDVELVDLSGKVAVKSKTGDVTGVGLRASDLVALTTAGDVNLALTGSPSSVEVSTSSGDIDVVVPSARYAVDLKSDSGDASLSGVTNDGSSSRSIRTVSDSGDISVAGAAS